MKNKVADKLNKGLRETKKRAEKEKAFLVKAHKSEGLEKRSGRRNQKANHIRK